MRMRMMRSESSGWMERHKGAHIETVGAVWWCGDDCGCSEAQVVSFFRNKVVPAARVPVCDWSGEFRTDFEAGADADLAEYRRRLRATDPEQEARIRWEVSIWA